MGTAGRIVGGLFVAIVAIALVSRPLLTNPVFAGLLEGELSTRQTLVTLPLVLVTVLLVVGRLRSAGAERGRSEQASGSDRESVDANQLVDRDGQRSDGSPTSERGEAADGPVDEDGRLDLEDDPPGAGLDDHLDHLRAEFEGDEDVLEDLETLESVAAEADDASIPKRCPGDFCEARWTERTILGGEAGRYQVLDDGRVLCEGCEGIFDVA